MQAQIFNFQTWINETDQSFLKALMRDLLEKAGFTTLKSVEHSYQPQGYTAVWLLAESHLAIHTFPEEGKTYIEISSCNETKNKRFTRLLDERMRERSLKPNRNLA